MACPIPPPAAAPTSAEAEDRRREHDPDQRADRGTGPSAVLGRLLVLGDVHLAIIVLVGQRDVIAADQIGGMEVKQRVVIGIGLITTANTAPYTNTGMSS